MDAQDPSFQVCPTRIDHTRVLFAHKVAKKKCQERQRELYHKCFTCAWNNNYVSLHGVPPQDVVEIEQDSPHTSPIS